MPAHFKQHGNNKVMVFFGAIICNRMYQVNFHWVGDAIDQMLCRGVKMKLLAFILHSVKGQEAPTVVLYFHSMLKMCDLFMGWPVPGNDLMIALGKTVRNDIDRGLKQSMAQAGQYVGVFL